MSDARLPAREIDRARAAIEGFLAGIGAGAVFAAAERSRDLHVWADLLNFAFRRLRPLLSEPTLTHLDTAAMGTAAYVAMHALVGAAAGAALATLARGKLRAGLARAAAIASVLAAIDAAAFGRLWLHRGLPAAPGLWIVLAAASGAFAVAWVSARVSRVAPPQVLRALAFGLPAMALLLLAGMATTSLPGPRRPDAETVASAARSGSDERVLILAIDGIERGLLDEGIAEGRLPNFARLLRDGTTGPLRSIRTPKSPVVWTSVVTGMLPTTHGIRDFVTRRDGEAIPVSGRMRRVPALWNIAAPADYTVAFVNWYVSWPAEEVAGTIVSDRADFDGLSDRVYPAHLTAAVDSVRQTLDTHPWRGIGRFTQVGDSLEVFRREQWGPTRRAVDVLDRVVRHDLFTLESARLLLREEQPDLTALYFRGTDNTQHLFWKYRMAERGRRGLSETLYGTMADDEVRALAPVIDRYYDFADELVGEVIAMVDPRTSIVILSDHGFLANNERDTAYHMNHLLAAAGLAVSLPGEPGSVDERASRVFDPNADRFTDPVRRLRPGRAAANGKVALEEAKRTLSKARTDAGGAVFRRLSTGRDEDGPFLLARFHRGLAGAALSLGNGRLPAGSAIVPSGHSGDHAMDGFLLAAGPPFRKGGWVRGARAVDLTPTILHLLGAPAAADMEGVVLTDLFTEAWAEEHGVRMVESYGARDSATTEGIATDADERIREELRALGYIQ
ncbi:MAG: alkaline phosphatase family protein [Gemmatimonadota bacterium]|nr:alkaline phosphatase family protein [Gemmatimonadota bacterium]